MLHTNFWDCIWHLSDLMVTTWNSKLTYSLHVIHLMNIIKDEGFVVWVHHVITSLPEILIMRYIMQSRFKVVGTFTVIRDSLPEIDRVL